MSFAVTSGLDLWLPKAEAYNVRRYDGRGKLLSTSRHSGAAWKAETGELRPLELAMFEIEAGK
jgi:hypothetical protein